jgi:hypothetical protein
MNMLKTVNWELLGALTAFVVCVTMLFTMPKQQGRVYDCGLAEISPDYPMQVKEECRKLRSQKIQ